jgi:septum formation protein
MTPVLMRDYTDAEIDGYIASGDPMDKAGAYAIQHPRFKPVARIDGCFANVMGLPMCHLYRALRAWDFVPPVHPLRCCPLATTSGCCWSREILARPVDV